jgi:hypothetical protein
VEAAARRKLEGCCPFPKLPVLRHLALDGVPIGYPLLNLVKLS